MADFIATFFTHYDAMQFKRQLEAAGGSGTMCPVPRWLSSSCGTCVRFSFDADKVKELPCGDLERLVQTQGEESRDIVDNR